jgi:hypothetical protein
MYKESEINLPPKTRGFLVSTFDKEGLEFLHWHNLEKFINSWAQALPDVEKNNIKDELYTQVIHYNPNFTILWLAVIKLDDNLLGLKYGIEARPLSLLEIAESKKLPIDKVTLTYSLWKSSCLTPEEACSKTKLSMKMLLELSELFEYVVK